MSDNRTRAQRSYNMSRIRSTNTKPEILVRKFLSANGFYFRLHSKKLIGKPDIVIHKLKSAVFVNGCFWHGHKNCKNAKTPVANRKFWKNKIIVNSVRDKKNARLLRRDGWGVYEIWECQLHKNKIAKTMEKLLQKLSNKN